MGPQYVRRSWSGHSATGLPSGAGLPQQKEAGALRTEAEGGGGGEKETVWGEALPASKEPY